VFSVISHTSVSWNTITLRSPESVKGVKNITFNDNLVLLSSASAEGYTITKRTLVPKHYRLAERTGMVAGGCFLFRA
jgi:hypothetical protein